jgi:hypothetical protein
VQRFIAAVVFAAGHCDSFLCFLCDHICFVLFFADLPGLAVPRRF